MPPKAVPVAIGVGGCVSSCDRTRLVLGEREGTQRRAEQGRYTEIRTMLLSEAA